MEPNEKIAKLENESQNKEASENVENVNTKVKLKFNALFNI